jgi:hypothetical protein
MTVFEQAVSMGIPEKILKGKSDAEIWKIIADKANNEVAQHLAEEEKKAFIGLDKELGKIASFFEKPTKVYVKTFGAKGSPTLVQIIGYDSETSEYYAKSEKNFHFLTDDLIIKTSEEKLKIEAKIKAEKAKKAAETKAKREAKKS